MVAGFLCQVKRATTRAAADRYMQFRICILKELAKTIATLTCWLGSKSNIVVIDCCSCNSCFGLSVPERSAAILWLNIIVAIASPMVPPRTRACPSAPCKDAAKGVSWDSSYCSYAAYYNSSHLFYQAYLRVLSSAQMKRTRFLSQIQK